MFQIPEIFHSYDEDGPFQSCISCGKNLLEGSDEYLIEKAIKRYPGFDTTDVIFEYAMCITCMEKMRKTMSLESRQRIDGYFQNVFRNKEHDPNQMMQDFLQGNIDNLLKTCLVKDIDLADQTEYQIYAHCVGDSLMFPMVPFALSGACIEELQELISEKTRDEMDDFIDEHFGLPPELKDLIQPKDLILL